MAKKKKLKGRVNIIKNNNPKINPELIDKLNKTIKPKYLAWVVKMMMNMGYPNANPQVKREITLTLKETIKFFDKCLQPIQGLINYRKENQLGTTNLTDLYIYTTVDEVYAVCNNAIELRRRLNKNNPRKVGKEESQKIYEDDNFLVVAPLTQKASCKYGAKTKWCTASRGGGYFNSYMNKGVLYYLIVKDTSLLGSWSPFNFRRKSKDRSRYTKIAFLFGYGSYGGIEIYDAKDRDDSRTRYFIRQFGGRINIFKRLLNFRKDKNTDWLDSVTGKYHRNRKMVDSWIKVREAIHLHWSIHGKDRFFYKLHKEASHHKYKKEKPIRHMQRRGKMESARYLTLNTYDLVSDVGFGCLPSSVPQEPMWVREGQPPIEQESTVLRTTSNIMTEYPRQLGEPHDMYYRRLSYIQTRERAMRETRARIGRINE